MENELINLAQNALETFLSARATAEDAIIEILKKHDNFINLVPTEGKPKVVIFEDLSEGAYDSVNVEQEAVFAMRYDDKSGQLMLLTEASLSNYEWDTDYEFQFIEYGDEYPQDEDDLKHLETIMANISYYISFHETYIIRQNSLISLLSGIQAYL